MGYGLERVSDFILSQNKQPVPMSFSPWIRLEFYKQTIPGDEFKSIALRAIESLTKTCRQYHVIWQFSFNASEDSPAEIQEVIYTAVDKSLERCGTRIIPQRQAMAVFDLMLYYKDFEYLQTKLSLITA